MDQHTDPTCPTPAARTPRQWALARAVSEIDDHVAAAGWDGPAYVFALIRTAEALAADPAFAAEAPAELKEQAEGDPEHLTAVAQDELPAADDLETLLAQLAWPPAVAGVAVSVERVVLPPEAEAELGPQASMEECLAHPAREDVRMIVGVLRTEETWSVIRMRQHDDVVGAENLVPDLAQALLATLN